jgi:hypothetical protein
VDLPLSQKEVKLVKPVKPKSGDVVFNEIMADPFEGSEEFLELYNRGQSAIDLLDVQLATKKNGVWDKAYPLVSTSTLYFPGEYLVLCEEPNLVYPFYNVIDSNRFVQVNDLPNLPNDKGDIYLVGRSLNVIDHVHYESNFHFELIDDTRGISLEKINFAGKDSGKQAWASAAEGVGASPGLRNSQYSDFETKKRIELAHSTISPNNDGYQDRLELKIKPEGSEFQVKVDIFDLQGFLIKRLLPNQLIGTQTSLYWDGINEFGKVPQSGIYLLFVEGFNENGRLFRERLSFSLLR